MIGLKPREIWALGVGRTFQVAHPFNSMTAIQNIPSAIRPTVRETGIATCPDEAAVAPRHNQKPASPPRTIAPIWATDAELRRIIRAAAAATAIEARS